MLTIVLTLIGYGYDLAYLEAFGLRPQMLEHGPLDFLLRATYGLLPLIDKSTALKELLSTTEGLTRLWGDTEWMRYVGAAVALGITPDLVRAGLAHFDPDRQFSPPPAAPATTAALTEGGL